MCFRYVLGEMGKQDLAQNVSFVIFAKKDFISSICNHSPHMFQIPHNTALEGLSEGMLEAWKIYNVPKYGKIKANANRQNIESIIFEKTFSGLSSSLWLRARGRCTMFVTRSSTSLRSANRTLTVT